jgi:molybdopterin synthase catalytic subunit
MIQLTTNPIDATSLLTAAQQPAAGAVVLFLGITREMTGDVQTAALNYEAHAALAEAELSRLEQTARERWPLVECAIVHRLGLVPLTEASVAVVASSPHREAALAAAKWLIDELKTTVPIWKQEIGPTGATSWVHPEALLPEEWTL